jgi:hypothetical protein
MANKEPTELQDLVVTEISLVKQGANRKRFKILKEDGAPIENNEVFMEELPYAEVLKADLGTEDNLRETLKKKTPDLSTDATEVSVALMKLATAYAEELPSDIFDTLAESAGFKKAATKKAKPAPTEDDEDEEPDGDEDDEEEVPQKKAKKMAKKATKMAKADEDSAVQKALEKITKEADIDLLPEDVQGPVRYLFKANETLETKIEKMEEEKRVKEFVAKADEFTHLPKTEKFAMLLKEMDEKLSPETFKAVEGIFKAADAGLKESNLFVEVGSTAAIEGTPEGKLAALAKARVEKSEGMTIEAAMAAETLAHPEIYEEMMRERKTL